MKSLKKALTSKELKEFWNTFQTGYAQHQEANLFPVFTMLCNLSNIENKLNRNKNQFNILDIACGPGTGIKYLIDRFYKHHKNIKIYGTDISEEMLSAAHNNLINEVFNSDYSVNFNNQEDPEATINLLERDNENLKFEDKKFNTIISNFSLHIVNNPENMLKETFRVLKDNSSACFSLWGDPLQSTTFTIVPNVLKKLKIDLPDNRSYFHLGNIENLRPLVLKAGFSSFNYCHSFVPFNIYTPKKFLKILENPLYKSIFENLDENTKQIVIENIEKEVQDELDSKKFIGLDSIILVCHKE